MKKFTILMGLFLATMITGQAMAQTVTLTMEDVNKIEQHIVGLNKQIEALEKEIAELKSQAKIKKNSDTVLEDFDVGKALKEAIEKDNEVTEYANKKNDEGFIIDSFYIKQEVGYAYVELDVADPAIKKIMCRIKNEHGKTIASGTSHYVKPGWIKQTINLDGNTTGLMTVSCQAQ